MNADAIIKLAQETIRTEVEGLENIISQIDESFVKTVACIVDLKGKVILTGIGKSGIIAKKIAATMVSLGTPAMFIHPVDGLHGDLGAVMPQDAAIVLSNSGNSKEINDLFPSLKKLGIKIIAITGNPDSDLAKKADIFLSCAVEREACNLGLAPTASSTAQLAMGDAIAVVVSHIKGFDQDAFKVFHPAGELGKQLMIRISQIMITGPRVPLVPIEAPLNQVVQEMTDKSLGFTLVGNTSRVEGIITDGDLRRVLLKKAASQPGLCARDIMSKGPKRISQDKLALHALDLMEQNQITSLIVVDSASKFAGVVHLHDLLGRGQLSLKSV